MVCLRPHRVLVFLCLHNIHFDLSCHVIMSSLFIRKMNPVLFFNLHQDSKIEITDLSGEKNKEFLVYISFLTIICYRIRNHSKTYWLNPTTIYYFSQLCGWNGLSKEVFLIGIVHTCSCIQLRVAKAGTSK